MKPGRLTIWLFTLGLLHGVVACAGFFAPYDPGEQDRERPYAPPDRIRVVDPQGRFHLRPFFYSRVKEGDLSGDGVDGNKPVPLHFLVMGQRYHLLGVIPCRTHLFGAGSGRIYLLGSDAYGRDQFSRVLCGGQISLLAGLLAASLTLILGAAIGMTAGYFGGWRDALLMRLAELFASLPWLYLLFGLRAFLPLSVTPLKAFLLVVAVIGTIAWARPARLVRGVVIGEKERDFVRAARGFGASNAYLLRRHILPATASVLLTQAAILVPHFVLAEMTLSFLGLGVPEPVPSWGNLLANFQQYSVLVSYWWMYLPAVAIVPFFLGYQGLASALQERASPYKTEPWSSGGAE